jgi:hypothetical protein
MMDGGLTYNNQKPEWSVRRAIQLNAGLTKLTVNGKIVDMRKHKKKIVPTSDDDVIGLPG